MTLYPSDFQASLIYIYLRGREIRLLLMLSELHRVLETNSKLIQPATERLYNEASHPVQILLTLNFIPP